LTPCMLSRSSCTLTVTSDSVLCMLYASASCPPAPPPSPAPPLPPVAAPSAPLSLSRTSPRSAATGLCNSWPWGGAGVGSRSGLGRAGGWVLSASCGRRQVVEDVVPGGSAVVAAAGLGECGGAAAGDAAGDGDTIVAVACAAVAARTRSLACPRRRSHHRAPQPHARSARTCERVHASAHMRARARVLAHARERAPRAAGNWRARWQGLDRRHGAPRRRGPGPRALAPCGICPSAKASTNASRSLTLNRNLQPTQHLNLNSKPTPTHHLALTLVPPDKSRHVSASCIACACVFPRVGGGLQKP